MTPKETHDTPAADRWIDKHEAARQLGITWSRVLELAKKGKIRSRRERDPVLKQTVVKLHAGDVERYAYDRDHPEPKLNRDCSAEIAEALTKRENTVVEAVSNSQIATDLSVKEDTVESHLNRIYEKLGVGGRLELIVQALTRNPAYEAEREAARKQPPWLTLKEAAEYSGLTRRWLRELAEEVADLATSPKQRGVNIAIRDMGKHAPGGRWRFHRQSLEDFSNRW